MDKVFNIFKSISDEKTISQIDGASRIFDKLGDKKTIAEIEQKLMYGDFNIDIKSEIIEKTVDILLSQIKQMKLKKELESITLKAGESEHPFPANAVISCGGENVELHSEFIKPKELHYEINAISADYNFAYSNNPTVILETYQEIVEKLQHLNWNSICIVSQGFVVNYMY